MYSPNAIIKRDATNKKCSTSTNQCKSNISHQSAQLSQIAVFNDISDSDAREIPPVLATNGKFTMKFCLGNNNVICIIYNIFAQEINKNEFPQPFTEILAQIPTFAPTKKVPSSSPKNTTATPRPESKPDTIHAQVTNIVPLSILSGEQNISKILPRRNQ